MAKTVQTAKGKAANVTTATPDPKPTEAEKKMIAGLSAVVPSLRSAYDAAEEAGKSPEYTASLERFLTAKDDVMMAIPYVFAGMVAAHSVQRLRAMPRPDFGPDNPSRQSLGHNNPDLYHTTRKKKDGSSAFVEDGGSWWAGYADRTPVGRAIVEALNRLDNEEGEYSGGKSPRFLANESDWLTRRQTNLRNVIKQTYATWLVWDTIEREMGDNVKLLWATTVAPNGKARVLQVCPKPIVIIDKIAPVGGDEGDTWTRMSAGQFRTLNVALAIQNGGTYADLIKTAQREQAESDDDNPFPELTVDGVAGFADRGVAFFKSRQNLDLFLRRLNDDPEAYAAEAEALYNLHLEIQQRWMPALRPHLKKLTTPAEQKQEKQAAAVA